MFSPFTNCGTSLLKSYKLVDVEPHNTNDAYQENMDNAHIIINLVFFLTIQKHIKSAKIPRMLGIPQLIYM